MSTTPFTIPATDLDTDALLALRDQIVLSNAALTKAIDAELTRRAGGSAPVAPPPPAPAPPPPPKRSRLDGIVGALVTVPVVVFAAGIVLFPVIAVGSAVVSVARRALAPAPAPVVAPAPAPAAVARPEEPSPLASRYGSAGPVGSVVARPTPPAPALPPPAAAAPPVVPMFPPPPTSRDLARRPLSPGQIEQQESMALVEALCSPSRSAFISHR